MRFKFLLAIFLLLPASLCGAEPASPLELIRQAGELVRQGEWDRSETVYLKAAASPEIDHRIQAYDGLVTLYTKLRLFKKAGRARDCLDAEKKLLARLIPEEKQYYTSYKVESGDTYMKIAAEHKVSLRWLVRANKKKPLHAGDTLRLPKYSYQLVIDKAARMLSWKRNGELMKEYPIAIGRKGMESPEGKFRIINRVANPIWYHDGREIPAGSPENLLGTRWLGINQKGYGIHGTLHPESIRAASSHGCIRMFNHDIEEMFEWIPVGTEVVIQNGKKR